MPVSLSRAFLLAAGLCLLAACDVPEPAQDDAPPVAVTPAKKPAPIPGPAPVKKKPPVVIDFDDGGSGGGGWS